MARKESKLIIGHEELKVILERKFNIDIEDIRVNNTIIESIEVIIEIELLTEEK